MKKFGKFPRAKRFTPPAPTRGGGFAPEKIVEQPLTGIVHQLKAAQGEERLARTLNKAIGKGMVKQYFFRYSPGMPRNTVGWKELDFLIDTPARTLAVSVKGEAFVHKTGSERQQDKLNELIILGRLHDMGIDVPNVTSVPAESLATQEQADKVGRDLGVYR